MVIKKFKEFKNDARKAKKSLEDKILKLPEVVGVSLVDGDTIEVYVSSRKVPNGIPSEWMGYPIRVVESGKISAQAVKEDGEMADAGFTTLGSLDGMGAPVLASRGVVGSGDAWSSFSRRKKKKKARVKESNEEWVTAKDVAEDDGFYSDMYKDEVGVRPRGLSDQQLADWLNDNYYVKDGKIVKK